MDEYEDGAISIEEELVVGYSSIDSTEDMAVGGAYSCAVITDEQRKKKLEGYHTIHVQKLRSSKN